MRLCFQNGNIQKIHYTLWRLTKTVNQLINHVCFFVFRLKFRNSFINVQFLEFIFNITDRNKCVNLYFDTRFIFFLRHFFSFALFHGFIEHFTVQIIPDCFHVSMLACTQKITCPSYFQIPHGNAESRTKFRKLLNRRQTFFCHFF